MIVEPGSNSVSGRIELIDREALAHLEVIIQRITASEQGVNPCVTNIVFYTTKSVLLVGGDIICYGGSLLLGTDDRCHLSIEVTLVLHHHLEIITTGIDQ